MPVQELEGQRGEGAYFRRGLIFGKIRYYNSFVPSSIRAWNSLEEDLVLTPSLQSFKLALKSSPT